MEPLSKLEKQPIILVYYKFRGMAQIVRQLLCYLDLSFQDIYLEQYHQQKLFLPTTVLNRLKGITIDQAVLPLLIHQDMIIYQVYPIVAYLCRRFNREDLLGINLQQKAKVQEIMEIYMRYLPNGIKMLINFAEQAALIEQDELLLPKISEWYMQFLAVSGYMRELSEMLLQQEDPFFVLGNITIVDFYYVESAHFLLGMFGCITMEIANERWHPRILAYNGKTKGIKYLKAIKRYHEAMKNQPYYLKHKGYLQSYSVIGSLGSKTTASGMAKLWATDIQNLI